MWQLWLTAVSQGRSNRCFSHILMYMRTCCYDSWTIITCCTHTFTTTTLLVRILTYIICRYMNMYEVKQSLLIRYADETYPRGLVIPSSVIIVGVLSVGGWWGQHRVPTTIHGQTVHTRKLIRTHNLSLIHIHPQSSYFSYEISSWNVINYENYKITSTDFVRPTWYWSCSADFL